MAAGSRAEQFQGWLAARFLNLAGLLPLDFVSALGGFIARVVGPRIGISRRAAINLERALPALSATERQRIIREVWDNLGRVVTEYAHLTRIRCFGPDAEVRVIGTEHVDAAKALGKPLIIFSGHFGNWEIGGIAAVQYGLDIVQVYRAANNPAVERVMHGLRRSLGVDPVAKGASGARRLVSAIKQGRTIMMLVDQKMNDGIAVPFFGRDAMTAPAIAELALRYDCTLLPARVRRIAGQARFVVQIEPPLELIRTGTPKTDVLAAMTRINQLLEIWIREAPSQWFWLHRRWPSG